MLIRILIITVFFATVVYCDVFDVLHYEIYIDLYKGLVERNGFYNGSVKIRFFLKENASIVKFHAVKDVVSVDSVLLLKTSSGWFNVELNFQQGSENLDVNFPTVFPSGDTVELKVYFRRSSNLDRGYYFYKKEEAQIPYDIAYTMTEPSDARFWFPCYDEPWDKATVELVIKVPKNFLVAGNGLLIRDEIIGDERIFYWRSTFPMSTYLIAFATSEYITFSDWYKRVTNPADSIEIKYYVWREDSLKAVNAFKNVVDMMKFFSVKFGEYPFEKYGMVAVYPFSYGGMEHQTITTINRRWLNGNYEGGIAHELAHQWWGDLVTCENWAEIWMNEGFASYGDALYTEYKYGKDAFVSKLKSWANSYFKEDSSIRYAIYNPPPGKLFGTAVYFKGAWVLHMLRNLIDDSTFFKVLQEWGKRYAYGTGTTRKFNDVVNEITKSNFDWFFEQWVLDSGYPVFDFYITAIDSQIVINIRQVQKNSRIFKVPVEFKVSTQGFDTLLTFWNHTPDTIYVVKFGFTVNRNDLKIEFDPSEKILKKVNAIVINKAESSTPLNFKLYQNYPNPFNFETKIDFEIGGMASKIYKCKISLYDVLGRKVREIFVGELPVGRYSLDLKLNDLVSGIYFCELVVIDVGGIVYRDKVKMVLLK
jgi:aminopeptidase N